MHSQLAYALSCEAAYSVMGNRGACALMRVMRSAPRIRIVCVRTRNALHCSRCVRNYGGCLCVFASFFTDAGRQRAAARRESRKKCEPSISRVSDAYESLPFPSLIFSRLSFALPIRSPAAYTNSSFFCLMQPSSPSAPASDLDHCHSDRLSSFLQAICRRS